MRIQIFPKDKIEKKHYPAIVEGRSFWSLQIDGDLGSDEIPVNLVGADLDDSLTGANGTANQPLLDENGDAVVLSASSPNPMGFYRPASIQIVKPVTANNVGVMLLYGRE